MNFQVSILKVLSSYPNGVATHTQLKRDIEILATSGRDWAVHSKQLAAEFPSLDIFSLKLVERYSFGWRLTKKGFIMIEMMTELIRRPVPALYKISAEVDRREAEVTDSSDTKSMVKPISSSVNRRARFGVIEGGKSKAA